MAVVSILDNVISADGCSLKHIQFRQKWAFLALDVQEMNYLQDFVRRYNELFSTRDMICSKCNEVIHGVSDWMNEYNIRNNKTCYDCLAPLCGDCRRDDVFHGGVVFCLKSCTPCDKTYCTDCVSVTRCSSCSEAYCEGCVEMEACDECQEASCEDCLNTCGGCNRTLCGECAEFRHCEGTNCNKAHCRDCYNSDNDNEHSVKYCEECESLYCSDCKFVELRDFGVRCNACAGDVAHLIVEEMGKLRKKNEELGKENEELREKVESMSL